MALQIAGRAGRFGTKWEHGYVTTFKPTDIATLKFLLSQSPEPITQAGLHPTADQIELYAYHLPNSSMSNLIVSELILIEPKKNNNQFLIFRFYNFRIFSSHYQR